MSDIVDQAVESLMKLPKTERDRIAWEIIARLEDKSEWDRIVSSDASLKWLSIAGAKALKEYEKMEKRLAFKVISLPSQEYLREESYWSGFDDLPAKVRKLAESNYILWKENPAHPSLRFKQVHPDEPIFSFRVGLQHRTLGIQTPDEKLAWFWIGSFSQYQDVISQ